MRKILIIFFLTILLIYLTGNSNITIAKSNKKQVNDGFVKGATEIVIGNVPQFRNVTVHDPSVIRDNGTYYLFGSHLASAKSDDLIQWEQISSYVHEGNPLIPNVYEEMGEAFKWGQNDTFWAGDVVQLNDSRYHMYYSVCEGSSPRSALGLAVSDQVTGPYKNIDILLKSGMVGISEDGSIYDATVHPNTIDPHTFFDTESNLWMVYGSYSGGIYILKMDVDTGYPYPGQGYGKKLLGGNHSRIEGPYILYSPETEYYYLFLSFGGLDAVGGYNLRVVRSQNPDGPYYDAAGNNMINCSGPDGSFFDDDAIEPYGVKLMGNFRFLTEDGPTGIGYVSPGHNSAYYEAETGKYYIFFHSRFPGKGEMHQVRVHQMFMNEDGWPVITLHRYAGETIEHYSLEEIIGKYAYVKHDRDISSDIKDSVIIQFNEDSTISGSINGQWQQIGDYSIELTIDGVSYTGVLLRQWDNGKKQYVMTFTALSKDGIAIWGSQLSRDTIF